jgi:hypothetical protein
MRRQLTLVLCWLVMLGNFTTWMFSVGVAAGDQSFVPYMIQLCVTAVLSFACAVILRKRVVKEICAERKK